MWTRARRTGHPDGILLGRLVTARVLASEFFFLFFFFLTEIAGVVGNNLLLLSFEE